MTKFTKSAAAAAAAILVSVTLAGCGGDEKTDITTVKVGVVGEYNAQWDTVNKLLEKDKIKVELVKYSDYATPNRALSDKEIDLNAFQHKAYLANDIKRNGYKIVAIGDTLVTPLRIFNNKQKIKAIADIKDGDKIAIDIPNYSLKLLVSDEEMEERKKTMKIREPKKLTGYLKRYAKNVSSADKGAIVE